MRLVDQFIAGSMFLIALYLVFSSRGNLNTVLKTAGSGVTGITGVLQGRGGNSGLPAYTQPAVYNGGTVYTPPISSILGNLIGLFGNQSNTGVITY